MNTSHFLVLTFTTIFSIAYLNFCDSNNERSSFVDSARIWPNISDNHSFLQWPLPGLQGAGGLDIDFYQKFARAVNFSRAVPYLVATAGNFTLAQVVVMGAVGALACGAAALIAESILFQHYEKKLFHHHDPHARILDRVSRAVPLRLPYHANQRHFKAHTNSIRKSNKRPFTRPSHFKQRYPTHNNNRKPQLSRKNYRHDRRRPAAANRLSRVKPKNIRPSPYFFQNSPRRGPDYV